MSNLSLNTDALIVIVNALLWAAHDTRLPQEERLTYQSLADKLAEIVVPLVKERDETIYNNSSTDSVNSAVAQSGDTTASTDDNDNDAS